MNIYPWQETQWQQFTEQFTKNRLAHALLLVGSEGTGKNDFAKQTAIFLLCTNATGQVACGKCRSCELNAAGFHPDLLWIAPEEEGKQIKIADIREINEFANQTAQQGGYRVVVISPAEAMNNNSANALLKNLEEPGSKTLFLLVSHMPSRVPATIRSRCQRVELIQPGEQEALQWLSSKVSDPQEAQAVLALAGGAPLRALSLFEGDALTQQTMMIESLLKLSNGKLSATAVASEWNNADVSLALNWLLVWLTDVVKNTLTNTIKSNKNNKLADLYKVVSNGTSLEYLYQYIDKVNDARMALLSTANPNKQMLLEELLIIWSRLIKVR